MEQLNTKKDSWLAWSLFVCLVLALSMTLTACGGKKNSGRTGSTPAKDDDVIVDHDCSTCGSYKKLVDAGLNLSHQQFGYFLMSLNVYGTSTPDTGYNGKVKVEGYIKVLQPYYTSCGMIPKGNYKVRSVDDNATYSVSQTTFNLTNARTEIIVDKVKVPFTLAGIEFENYSQRNFKEGSKTYIYNGSFYGTAFFCNNYNEQTTFMPEM